MAGRQQLDQTKMPMYAWLPKYPDDGLQIWALAENESGPQPKIMTLAKVPQLSHTA